MNRLSMKGITIALAFVAALLLFPTSRASAMTSSTLYSDDFSLSSTFYSDWSGYESSFDGWYWTPYGLNGSNGCIAFNSYYGKTSQQLSSPSIDASAYTTAGDSTFIEFDLNMRKLYYDQYSGSNTTLIVYAGTTQLLKMTKNDWNNGFQYSFGYYNWPNSWTSSFYWKHFRVFVPKASRTSTMQVVFEAQGTNQYGYYYPESQPIFIDNVSVTNNRYTFLTIGPSSMAFGDLGTGLTSAPQYVTITNPNAVASNISNIQLVGSNAGDYEVVYSPSGPIQPGMSDSIGVVFAPTAKLLRTAVLTFNTDADIPTSFAVDLTGVGLVPAIGIPGGLTAFRKDLTKFDYSSTQTIYLTNTGRSPLIINQSTTYMDGDAPDEYQILYMPSSALAPGGMDSIVIKFTPIREGQQIAYLHINSNADNGEQVITLRAIGIVPHLEISPRSIYFDSTDVGGSSSVTITLLNSGTDTLALEHSLLSIADYDYTASMPSGSDTILLPSQSRTVTLTFHPLRSGTRVGTMAFYTNIPKTFENPRRDTSLETVTIMGYAVPVGILSVGTTHTDSVIIGVQACQNDTVYNTGAADITLTNASVTGRDGADFAISGLTLPLVIPSGGSHVFSVCMTPSARGDRQAALAITGTSNERSLSASASLAGFGWEVCANAPSAATLADHTCVGYTDTAVVTVQNCGDVPTAYTAALASGATDYAIVGSATSATVASNGTATFQVVYTPTTRGANATNLTITGGTGVTPMTVSITGNGTAASIAGTGTAPETSVGATSAAFAVTVQNTGECDFVPGTPTVTGPFAYVSGGATPIAAGGSGTLMFTFTPTKAGTETGIVSFPGAAGVSIPAANVTITGSTPSASVAERSAFGFSLKQNYPNPFFPKTQIDFVVPYTTHVTLDLLDANGSYLGTIYSGHATQGTNTAMVDASMLTHASSITGASLSSGTYFYRLTAESQNGEPVVLVRQMTLVK